MGSRHWNGGIVALALLLAGCTVKPLASLGRPCSNVQSCGPGATCDPVQGVCVTSASPDSSSRDVVVTRDLFTEGGREQSVPPDLFRADLPACPTGTSEGTPCDDHLFCTMEDRCQAGKCVGTARSCSPSSDPCVTSVCDEAAKGCTTKPRPDGTTCTGGLCFKGSCCAGCWDGQSCLAGAGQTACGSLGHACVDCSACTSFSMGCGGGTKHCQGIPKGDGSTCTGGLCYDGGCCEGCFDGQYCQAGSTDTRCGSGGVSCVDCTQTECRAAASSCSQGACGAPAKPDGSACTGGLCYGGLCCKGCWDGTKKKCVTGTTASACGVGGAACKACPSAPTCKQYSCQNGSCSLGNAADGAGCTSGTCYSGTCCGGCWTGTMCAGGGTDDQCGSGGSACTSCTAAGLICSNGACVPPG